MPSVIQPAEFFVVAGPVRPERPCYVERAADRRLVDALRAKRLCCVLGPRGIGKTSLLQRAARLLRGAGALSVVVELRRVAEQRGEAPDGWLQRIAEQISAGLSLGIDVGEWWADHDAVGNNRLVAFLWQAVLTNTTAPVAVLFDDVEAVLDLPFAGELFDAIDACYERRGREPDFGRLTFVVAGCASQRELGEHNAEAQVVAAELIEPEDFTPEQSYRFAVAFGGEQQLAQALMDRICSWTGGHPYLTQRVARGVARKGGRLEDVERVVQEQLLTPEAAARDIVLRELREQLGEPSRAARRAAVLLHKLAVGRKVAQPADAEVWETLWLSGAARLEGERRLAVRNRVVKELVAEGWLKAKRDLSRWVAAAAVLVVAIAAGAYWYTQRLPEADLATLTDPASELTAAESSYRRLIALPGFEQRAAALWREVLTRHSRDAATLAEAVAADTRLRELPGQDEAADRLLSEFWLRRARGKAHLEQREAAILLAQRAAALPAADASAAAYLAELVGEDYERLERTLRLPGSPEYWHMGFADGSLVSIDADRQVLRTPFGAVAGLGTLGAAPVELTALVHSALTRELSVEGEGTAGALELSLILQHPATGELLVTLTAPSGASAVVTMPRNDGTSVETFAFQAAPGTPLGALADEGIQGVWRLTLVDRELGNTGVFGGWGLTFGDTFPYDDPPELVPIPDPQRSGEVVVQAVADRALAWPAEPGVIGTVSLWNLATGRLERDLTLPAAPRRVALDPTGSRVLAATDRLLTIWDAASGAVVARIGTETEFVLSPVFSADGGYVAIAERVDSGGPLYSVLRSADGMLVSTITGPADVEGWELGPGGRYLALQGPETVIRVLETRRGAELRRLPHERAVERLLHTGDGTSLVTVDLTGAIALWPLAIGSQELGRPLGHTAATASVSASGDGRRLAFTRDDGAVAVLDLSARAELYRLRIPRAMPVTSTQLSSDGMLLVTQSASTLRLWRLPAKPITPQTRASDAQPTAIAIDRASDLVAVGLASGQLEIVSGPASVAPPLSFFGHRGPVTAAVLDATLGIAATGGSDGIVRLWELASNAPIGIVAQPTAGAISVVALSSDGRRVASATERTVRVARAIDGVVEGEWQVAGRVTALVFAPEGERIAIGDAAGGVTIVAPAGAADVVAAQLGGAVTSLAYAPGGGRLAVGEATGAVALVDGTTAAVERTVRHWTQPTRWLEFTADGNTLVVATDAWAHALASPALEPDASELVVWPAASPAWAAVSATQIGFAGVGGDGSVILGAVDLAAAANPGAVNSAPLVARDWPTALALRLDDNAEVVAFDP